MRSESVQLVIVAVVSLWTFDAFAAPFVNLDFEQATVVPVGGDFIQAAPAFPGWTPRIDSNTISNAAYNYVGFGEPLVSLFDVPAPGIGLPLLQGQYMAALVSRSGFPIHSSLEQTGEVPGDAVTIRMLADLDLGPPIVKMNGVVVPMQLLIPSFVHGSLFAGEISTFAGSNVLLQLSSSQPPSRLVGFDAIEFSYLPIPEPASAVLILSSMWILLSRRTYGLECRGVAKFGKESWAGKHSSW
jgi:hypothetical protein